MIAIEPDPVALSRLKKNISANNFNNIVLIEKGLSSENGITQFGGNGSLGNSESTLLIANKEEYLSYEGRHTKTHNHNEIVEIETITIEKLIEQQNIDTQNTTSYCNLNLCCAITSGGLFALTMALVYNYL